jgi:hypothetical protein
MADITPLSEQRSHLMARGANNSDTTAYERIAKLRRMTARQGWIGARPEGFLRRRVEGIREFASNAVTWTRRALSERRSEPALPPSTREQAVTGTGPLAEQAQVVEVTNQAEYVTTEPEHVGEKQGPTADKSELLIHFDVDEKPAKPARKRKSPAKPTQPAKDGDTSTSIPTEELNAPPVPTTQ